MLTLNVISVLWINCNPSITFGSGDKDLLAISLLVSKLILIGDLAGDVGGEYANLGEICKGEGNRGDDCSEIRGLFVGDVLMGELRMAFELGGLSRILLLGLSRSVRCLPSNTGEFLGGEFTEGDLWMVIFGGENLSRSSTDLSPFRMK